MSKIVLDSEEIVRLCHTAEGFAMDASSEEALCKLLDIQDKVNELVENVKQNIVDIALVVDSDFTSIVGDKVKLEYRAYGSEYAVSDMSLLNSSFKKTSKKEELDVKAVKEYEEFTGRLPDGVVRKERKRVLTIKRKV